MFTDQPTVVFTSVGGRHDSSIISSYLLLLLLLVVTYDKKHPNLEKRGKNLNTFSDEVETICNLSKKHQLRETISQCIVPGMSFDGLKIHHRIYYLVTYILLQQPSTTEKVFYSSRDSPLFALHINPLSD